MSLKKSGIPTYTWATKPAIADWAVYAPIIITDIGPAGSMWYHQGVNWRPLNGEVVLRAGMGSVATPLATLTGTTSTSFTLPGGNVVLPAGILVPGVSIIEVEWRTTKTGTAGSVNLLSWVGTNSAPTGTWTNVQWMTFQNSISTSLNNRGLFSGWFPGATTLTRDYSLAPFSNNQNAMTDSSAGINTAVEMYAGLGMANGNVGDTYSLIEYSFKLKG